MLEGAKTHPFKVYVDRELQILLESPPLEKSAAFPWSLNSFFLFILRESTTVLFLVTSCILSPSEGNLVVCRST